VRDQQEGAGALLERRRQRREEAPLAAQRVQLGAQLRGLPPEAPLAGLAARLPPGPVHSLACRQAKACLAFHLAA
jgi:hypothetical protein